MRYFLIPLGLLLSVTTTHAQVREAIVGIPCEGCEAVFEGKPSNIPERCRIAAANEPGQGLVLVGHVTDSRAKPVPDVIVYAYHTNAKEIYPTDDRTRGMASHRHEMLRAWAKTNRNGNYAFDTIRPAGYPATDLPQHIHMHVIEPGCSTYYIDDSMFRDDPRLTGVQTRRLTLDRGGSGLSTPKRVKNIWYVRRDIGLGQNIPGHLSCGPGGCEPM